VFVSLFVLTAQTEENEKYQHASAHHDGMVVYALNTLQQSSTCHSGEMSYPIFRRVPLAYPDVSLLARLAEQSGVDFRVIVLARAAGAMLNSTTRRSFGTYRRNAALLAEAAAVLSEQMKQIDPAFYSCLSYDVAVRGEEAESRRELGILDTLLFGNSSLSSDVSFFVLFPNSFPVVVFLICVLVSFTFE